METKLLKNRNFVSAFAALAAILLVPLLTVQAADPVRIALANPHWAPYAAVYLADERGYYQANGVTVEITAYRGGGAAQQALAAGEADIINYTPPGVALAVSKGVKEKIVGAGMPTPLGWHIMVGPDSAITSPADLAGKKVGVTRKGSTTDFFALWVAQKAGVEIETVPVGYGSLIPALKAGEIDAGSMSSTLSAQLLFSGEGRSLVNLGKEMDPVLPDVWVASQEILDNRPEAVEAVLQAVYKANITLTEDREFGLSYLKAFSRIEDDRIVAHEFDEVLTGRMTDARIDPAWLESALGLARLSGLEELPAVEELYTDRFSHVSGRD